MRAVSTLTAIGAALWMIASSAAALGFGQVVNTSQLGQPLNFVAIVRVDGDEALSRECITAEVVSGENRLAPEQVRIALEGPVDASERRVRVRTLGLIDEPVVAVSITLGCSAKVTRKFVSFIDPPVIRLAQASDAAAPVQAIRTDTPLPSVQIARVDEPRTPTTRTPTPRAERKPPRRRASAPRTVHLGAAPQPAVQPPGPTRARAASRQSTAVARTAEGPQLKLEAAAPEAAPSASSPAAAVAVAAALPSKAEPAASASNVDDPAAQLARERDRVLQLEQGLAALRKENQAAQTSIAALQARIKEADAERSASPLVYALAALAALLALLVAALWSRRGRGSGTGQWWATPEAAAAERALPHPAPLPPPVRAAVAEAFEEAAVAEAAEPFTPATIPAPEPAPAVRELSVEELIDLEQQVEFFIVLGQDDAAIDLLMSHVRSDGGSGPLPYLKLLEIYRRQGDREGHDRIRERFNRRFNAVAPRWEHESQEGRTLDGYPEACARLQAQWSDPAQVMETLQASLVRRKGGDETFDLAAYRELLFLYSIARDLSEHAGGDDALAAVDVLLPLDEGDAPTAGWAGAVAGHPPGPAARATGAASRRDAVTATAEDSDVVDFDLRVPAAVGARPPER